MFLIRYLRVIIVTETFSEGVMVYFQLSDLCEEEEEESNEKERRPLVSQDKSISSCLIKTLTCTK